MCVHATRIPGAGTANRRALIAAPGRSVRPAALAGVAARGVAGIAVLLDSVRILLVSVFMWRDSRPGAPWE
jgi:hypothetical protein